jgi:deoxyribodipyrimidine photolyase-like uncharacterized protein
MYDRNYQFQTMPYMLIALYITINSNIIGACFAIMLRARNGSHLCELHNCYWDFH